MTTAKSWATFSISRATAPDNRKLGIGRWDQGSIDDYGKLIQAELADFVDTRKLSFTGLEPYNNEAYYTITARLFFDASYPTPAKAYVEGLGMQFARALSESSHIDIEALVINDFTFSKEGILSSKRGAFTTDLLKLSEALSGITPLTAPWFEFLVNEKGLMGDTLVPAVETQIARMKEVLELAGGKPFTGTGGNETHDQQTSVIFMNSAPKDGKMSALLRAKLLDGLAIPQDFISELQAAKNALVALSAVFEFKGRPPQLVPGDEVVKLASNFGPALDQGRSQISPAYMERTLLDFPLDTIQGKMMRYGMFLAAHLAMEIREGAGGTVNIRNLHLRLANELGATVTPPMPSVDDDYLSSPGP